MKQIRVYDLSFSITSIFKSLTVLGTFVKVQRNLPGQRPSTPYHRVSCVLYCVPSEKIIVVEHLLISITTQIKPGRPYFGDSNKNIGLICAAVEIIIDVH